jgi:hypothetical protein
MFIKTIPKATQSHLEVLAKRGILKNFYLVGGTAVALHLGHRISVDLDFFTAKNFNPRNLEKKLRKIGKFKRKILSEGTLTGIFNNINLTFLYYEYPLLETLSKCLGFKIASLSDLGCIKIDTISSRGKKRDFIDLYFICQEKKGLLELWKLFEKKYKGIDYSKIHIFRSLVYFEDAEKDKMPKMLKSVKWNQVKKFFEEEILKIVF